MRSWSVVMKLVNVYNSLLVNDRSSSEWSFLNQLEDYLLEMINC